MVFSSSWAPCIYQANHELSSETTVEVISTGTKVDLKEHLQVNRYVIFDFYADWSAPSRKWGPIVARLAADYPDRIALKRIKIKSWGTPVAIQYNLKQLPYMQLYSPDGKRKRRGHPRDIVAYLEKKAKKLKW